MQIQGCQPRADETTEAEGGGLMGGKASRRKGHDFERDIANRLREVMPGADIKRGLQSRGGGAEEADVVCPYFHVECKVGKLPNPRAALAQAVRDAKPGKVPVAIVKDDRQPPFVVMQLDEWLDFVKLVHWAGGMV